MPPRRIQFPTIRPTKHHVPHNFVLASSVSTTPISHRNSYSTTPSRQTQSPTAIQAVISCQVTQCPDSEQEKKDAVNRLQRVAMEVTKKLLGCEPNAKLAYVNHDGASILDSIEQMRSDLAEAQKESYKRLKEGLAEAQKESDKRLEGKLAEAQKESDKRLEESNEALELKMRPLETIAIAIRRRFFSNYRKQAGTTPGHRAAIKGGNIAAHHGDVITDTLLVACKDIEDTDIYRSLYWISPEQAEPYFNSKIMVKMINKRATMQADFRRGSKRWEVGRQDAFQKVLSFWDNADSDERRKFEDIDGDGLPEQRKWLSIACA